MDKPERGRGKTAEQADRQSRLYAAIAECAQAFAETRDLYEIIKRAVRIIREMIGFDRVGIFLYDERRGRWRGMYGTDPDGRLRDEREVIVTRDPRLPIMRAAADEGDEFFIENFSETFPEDETMRGVKNNFFIALRAHGRLLGGLSVDNLLSDRPIDEESRESLRRFARYVALALENLRLLQTLEEKNAALQQELEQREKAEQELQETLKRLYGANRDLEDFAAVLSHDIKAPLRGIASLAEWVREDYADRLDTEGLEKLELLIRRAQRLRHLIDGILRYSRVGTDRRETMEMESESVVRDVIDTLAPPAQIRIHVESPLPRIRYEPVQFEQIMQNLIANSLIHLGKPEGDIRICCCARDTEWEFCVKDNGVGIEEELRDRIFQTNRGHESAPETSGLGLAVVRKIVEHHGGSIRVESEVNRGSAFCFTVPKNLPQDRSAMSKGT